MSIVSPKDTDTNPLRRDGLAPAPGKEPTSLGFPSDRLGLRVGSCPEGSLYKNHYSLAKQRIKSLKTGNLERGPSGWIPDVIGFRAICAVSLTGGSPDHPGYIARVSVGRAVPRGVPHRLSRFAKPEATNFAQHRYYGNTGSEIMKRKNTRRQQHTMLAIFRKALTFVHPDTYKNYHRTTKEFLNPGEMAAAFPKITAANSFKVQPSLHPQNAPEWIRATTEFRLACADGVIRDVGGNRIGWPEPDAGEAIPLGNEAPATLPRVGGTEGSTGTTILSGRAADPLSGLPLGVPAKLGRGRR